MAAAMILLPAEPAHRKLSGHLREADEQLLLQRSAERKRCGRGGAAASQEQPRTPPTIRYEAKEWVSISKYAVTPATPRNNTPNKRRLSTISAQFEGEEEALAALADLQARYDSLRRQVRDKEAEVKHAQRERAAAVAAPRWRPQSSCGHTPRFRWRHVKTSADSMSTVTG
jgi:hypothetical protein